MVDHAEDGDADAPSGQESLDPELPGEAPSPARWNPLQPGGGAGLQGLGEGERVAKALARAGVASRREVERYIEAGRVALNGQVLTTPAIKVAPGDILTVDGAVVGGPEPTRLFRYHKPAGLITTNSDPQGRPTVFEHLPPWLPRVLAVGRLDLNTEGLLLLTNDGALSRALELPSSGWMRRYRARAYGRVDQAALDGLSEGVTVDGVAYGPIEARLDKASGHDRESGAANVWISIGITEGKNREVRKVLEHLGLKVNRLIRLAYGPFALSTLPLGGVEEVGPRVIREQLAEHVAPENLPTGDQAASPPSAAARAAPASAPRPTPKAAPRRGPAAVKSSGGRAERGTPAEGAERRLAETPRKGFAAARSGAKPNAGRGAGQESKSGLKRAWTDKPRGDRPRDSESPRPRRDEAKTDRPRAATPFRTPGPPRAEATAMRESSRAFARPTGERSGKAAGDRPGKLFGKPSAPRSASGKPGSGGKPWGAGKANPGKTAAGAPRRADKPAAAPSRTGLELTPPMRRTPRGSGPRRPPRKD